MKLKQSTKDLINIGGSISLCVFLTILGVVLYANAPKDPKPKPEPEPQKIEEYQPIYYKFSDGSWATISHHPFTGERGVEITQEELETLKIAQ
jgi:hypothetical protein